MVFGSQDVANAFMSSVFLAFDVQIQRYFIQKCAQSQGYLIRINAQNQGCLLIWIAAIGVERKWPLHYCQHLDDYKLKLIKLLIECKDWDRARAYIKKYLQEIKYNPSLEYGLITQMITISAQTLDTETHIEFQRRLFYLDNLKMKHYKGLKAICPPALWPSEKAQIESELKKKPYHEETLALIHLENKEYDKILELLIQQPGLSNLWLMYDKYAIQADRTRFITAYRDAIRAALMDTGRSLYEMAAEHLKHLHSVTQDRNLIRNLILELKSQYRNRRAMIEIFDREFGKLL